MTFFFRIITEAMTIFLKLIKFEMKIQSHKIITKVNNGSTAKFMDSSELITGTQFCCMS